MLALSALLAVDGWLSEALSPNRLTGTTIKNALPYLLIAFQLFLPIFMISLVLIYYDLRVRQEGFTRMLVQELNDD